ncbi:hypothetical protein DYBT9623_02618 [Dyadobacter sp. CECT 9623]|uniref:SGNH/GDSL hydrolase family protein n=1 Tax=Dyadobacter linearis TaxID=2823330 RepID=A0ABN7RCP7_9BACT|nr:hypothetical protein [Dyadobacter sp. CECT 9623]CAG5069881.1 hypothetical protein DYBT9623_02618 [Dyadobacter sp. CECT 9623]
MKQFVSRIAIFITITTGILGFSLFNIHSYKARESILGAVPDKHKMLSGAQSPKIIFVGGSNLAFGLDSRTIQRSLKMPVINAGVHASIGLKYQIRDIERFVNKSDIVIISPEYSQFYTDSFYGKAELLSVLFDIFPDGRKLVSLAHWYRLFPQIPQYAASKLKFESSSVSQGKIGVYHRAAFNENGDAFIHWDLPAKKVEVTKPETGEEEINNECIALLKDFDKLVKSKSASLFIIPPAYQSSSFKNQKNLIQKIHHGLLNNGISLLAPPKDYNFHDSLFFDTNYHLTKTGVDLRTKMVIGDLKAALPQLVSRR